jgi:hypothetical protein
VFSVYVAKCAGGSCGNAFPRPVFSKLGSCGEGVWVRLGGTIAACFSGVAVLVK